MEKIVVVDGVVTAPAYNLLQVLLHQKQVWYKSQVAKTKCPKVLAKLEAHAKLITELQNNL